MSGLPNPTGLRIENFLEAGKDFAVTKAEGAAPIPTGAESPPMRYHSAAQLPAGTYQRAIASELEKHTAAEILPPPP